MFIEKYCQFLGNIIIGIKSVFFNLPTKFLRGAVHKLWYRYFKFNKLYGIVGIVLLETPLYLKPSVGGYSTSLGHDYIGNNCVMVNL